MKNIKAQFIKYISLLILALLLNPIYAQNLERVTPESVGISSEKLVVVDELINNAIESELLPGAVLAIVKDDKMAYLKAYGDKEIIPNRLRMEENTIFDLASLTKPIATGTAIMQLVEQGKLRLIDKVNLYIPDFKPWSDGRQTKDIRIVDLLTHSSGLPAYAPVEELKKRYGSPNSDGLMNYIANCKREFEPLSKFQYSCLNFISLQHIIKAITNETIDEYTKKNIFEPLGMVNTTYNPDQTLYSQIAPTEVKKNGLPIVGVVHDPLAREMNAGISGNAGLFSNADDLAIYTAAILNGGEWNGQRILSPAAVKAFQSIPKEVEKFGRALSWDIHSAYASNQGDLLSYKTFGHTGFTGTSIVIDPELKLGIIFLTNSIHPNGKTSIVRLRSLVSNAIAASIVGKEKIPEKKAEPAQVWTYESHYIKRMEQFATERAINQNDIVMLGNSITEGGKWSQLLHMDNIRNRGISGDNTLGIYNRLDEILIGKPKKIFLLIGINDLASGLENDTIIYRISKIIRKIQTDSPETKLYLQSIFPIDESHQRYKGLNGKTNDVIYLNKQLKKLAKNLKITFINIHPQLSDKDKITLRKEYSSDGLHLNERGYNKWIKQIKRFIKK